MKMNLLTMNLLVILALETHVASVTTKCAGTTKGSCPPGQVCRSDPCYPLCLMASQWKCVDETLGDKEPTPDPAPSPAPGTDKCYGECSADEKCAFGLFNQCVSKGVCTTIPTYGWRCEKKEKDGCGGCPANQKCEQRKVPCGLACTALKFICVNQTDIAPPPAKQCSSFTFGECPSGQTCQRKSCPPGDVCTLALSYECVPSTNSECTKKCASDEVCVVNDPCKGWNFPFSCTRPISMVCQKKSKTTPLPLPTNKYGKCGYMNQKGTCPSGQECTESDPSCFVGKCTGNKKWKCKKVRTAIKPTPTQTKTNEENYETCTSNCSSDILSEPTATITITDDFMSYSTPTPTLTPGTDKCGGKCASDEKCAYGQIPQRCNSKGNCSRVAAFKWRCEKKAKDRCGGCPSGQVCHAMLGWRWQCKDITSSIKKPTPTSTPSPQPTNDGTDKCGGKCASDETCAYRQIPQRCNSKGNCSKMAYFKWRCEKKERDGCGGCPANQMCEQRKVPCGLACTALKFICVNQTDIAPPPAKQCSSFEFGECPLGQTCQTKPCPPVDVCPLQLSYECVPSTNSECTEKCASDEVCVMNDPCKGWNSSFSCTLPISMVCQKKSKTTPLPRPTNKYGKCGYMNQKGTCPSGQECSETNPSCFVGKCNKKWKCKKVRTAIKPTPTQTKTNEENYETCTSNCSSDILSEPTATITITDDFMSYSTPTPTPTPGTDKCGGKCAADEKCVLKSIYPPCAPNQPCSLLVQMRWTCEKKVKDDCGGCPTGHHCARTGNGQGFTCWPDGAPPLA